MLAQDDLPPPDAPPPGVTTSSSAVAPTPLEELVAPIALYPDALIALILPASTASSDIVIAARFLSVGGNANQIDTQPWDDSVKGLAHYPDVVKWMDQNLEWTQRLGEAYTDDPQAIMGAVQRARAHARANGVLVDTPQQQVVVEDSYIRIIPAQPDVIYVPRYDPEIIYIEQPTYYSPDPWLTFGIGFGVGSWLAFDCDWGRHSIWYDSHRHEHWREQRDWRYREFPGRAGYIARDSYWHRWTPPAGRPRPPHHDTNRWTHEVPRPAPLPGAPRFDRDRSRDSVNHFAGGNRPGVQGVQRSSGDRHRSIDTQTRSVRPMPGTLRSPASSGVMQNSAVATAQTAPAPIPQAQVSTEQRRGPADRPDRRIGVPGSPGQHSNAGSVSVVPNERRWQPGVTNGTHSGSNGERRRESADRDNERHIRPAMPAQRGNPTVSSPRPVAPAVQPQVQAQAPVVHTAPQVRPAPQVREYHQPQRVAPAATQSVASAAPVARAAAPQPQVDRGNSNGNNGNGGSRGESRSEGRGSRGDRQAQH